MKTIQIRNGPCVEVSEELYTMNSDPGQYRKIAGLEDNPKLGYHPNPGWICFVKEELCQQAWKESSIPLRDTYFRNEVYIGFHESWVILPEDNGS